MTTDSVAKEKLEPIWVRPSSSVPNLSDLILSAIRDHGEITLRAIGAGAVNQAMKSIVRARQRILTQADDMVVRPGMKTVRGDQGDDVAVVVLRCTLT